MAIIPGEQKIGASFAAPQKEKQKRMIYFFALVVLLIAVVFYFGFFKKDEAPAADLTVDSSISGAKTLSPAEQQAKLVEALSKIKLDNPLLNDKKFQSLVLPGQFPIAIGDKGRENPFATF